MIFVTPRHACLGLGLGLALALVTGCSAYVIPPGTPLGVRSGGVVEADLKAGYRAYGAVLAPDGRWSPDPLYGFRWCPSGVDVATFVPYRSNGRWAPADAAQARLYEVAAGTPVWVSDDADTHGWGDITSHHGWWTHDAGSRGAASAWCWIPGKEETAARVVWSEGDGFVAWAPEPPAYDDVAEVAAADADPDVDGSLDWRYELLGMLFDVVEDALLQGDAAWAANQATWSDRHSGSRVRLGARGTARTHAPPTQPQVAQARHALAQYLAAHPVAASALDSSGQPSGRAAASQGALAQASAHPTVSGAFAASSTSAGTGTSTAHRGSSLLALSDSPGQASSGTTFTVGGVTVHVEALPPGTSILDQMARDSLPDGPGFGASPLLPFGGAGPRFASSYQGGGNSGATWASGAGGAGARGAGAMAGFAAPHTAAYAASAPVHASSGSSRSHGGHSSGSSSSGGGSRSRK